MCVIGLHNLDSINTPSNMFYNSCSLLEKFRRLESVQMGFGLKVQTEEIHMSRDQISPIPLPTASMLAMFFVRLPP